MKYSEMKKRNEKLERENAVLKAIHAEHLRGGGELVKDRGYPKKLRVVRMIDPMRCAELGATQYVKNEFVDATNEIVRFLVAEGAVKVAEVEDPKTKDRALVFEMKVVP